MILPFTICFPEAYLGPSQTSTMEISYEDSQQRLVVNYFAKKFPSQMYDWVIKQFWFHILFLGRRSNLARQYFIKFLTIINYCTAFNGENDCILKEILISVFCKPLRNILHKHSFFVRLHNFYFRRNYQSCSMKKGVLRTPILQNTSGGCFYYYKISVSAFISE